MKSNAVRARIAQINGIGGQVINEAFTKQHYIAIAKIIKDAADTGEVNTAEKIANKLADLFASDNSQFRREQFLNACSFGK